MLSIRTQDRMALVPYNRMIRAYRETGKYVIRVENEQALGTYATKERAMEVLEVLDEIERHVVGKLLVPETSYHLADHLTLSSNPYIKEEYTKVEQLPTVYQMPEE